MMDIKTGIMNYFVTDNMSKWIVAVTTKIQCDVCISAIHSY